MNKLLCKHEFDMNNFLMSSPPKHKCKKCGCSATPDKIDEYLSSKIQDYFENGQSDKKDQIDPDVVDVWKNSVYAMLSSGVTTFAQNNSHSLTAMDVADKVVIGFKNRFKK